MKKFIEKISTALPYRGDGIEINLKGRNLIITGSNGSGKTSLVSSIHSKLIYIVKSKGLDQLDQWQKNREIWIHQRNDSIEGSSQYQKAKQSIENLDRKIESVIGDPSISINDHLEFSRMVDSGLGVVELFSAARQSQIRDARSASGINYNEKELVNQNLSAQIGNQLEQHLVNLYTRRSFSITERRDVGVGAGYNQVVI